jgi:cation:H+ antiporter
MQISSLSLPLLLLVFVAAAAAIWWAGIRLSNTTDALSDRFHLGEALGGTVILAIVTNLPEIAITVSAAIKGSLDLATGNILGGIALQTVVLVVLDVFGLGKKGALTFVAASMTLLLETLAVAAVLTLVVIGHQLPAKVSLFGISPASFMIALVWLTSLALVSKAGKGLPWKKQAVGQDDQAAGAGKSDKPQKKQDAGQSTAKVVGLFLFCSVLTLVAGVLLETSGEALAKQIHLDGLVFGATVLALATSLPEISTGLAAIKLGDYELAMSDILGGNAFLPVLFLLASAIAAKPSLPQAHPSDIYLTGVALLLTLIYSVGIIFRSPKQYMRMGIDSLTVLLVYLLSIGGLFLIAK